MALTIQTVTLDIGLTITNSYARIDTVAGSKEGITALLNYYVSQDAYNTGKSFVRQGRYSFVPSIEDTSQNFIKQAYVYLKTLPEFDGVIDA